MVNEDLTGEKTKTKKQNSVSQSFFSPLNTYYYHLIYNWIMDAKDSQRKKKIDYIL